MNDKAHQLALTSPSVIAPVGGKTRSDPRFKDGQMAGHFGKEEPSRRIGDEIRRVVVGILDELGLDHPLVNTSRTRLALLTRDRSPAELNLHLSDHWLGETVQLELAVDAQGIDPVGSTGMRTELAVKSAVGKRFVSR